MKTPIGLLVILALGVVGCGGVGPPGGTGGGGFGGVGGGFNGVGGGSSGTGGGSPQVDPQTCLQLCGTRATGMCGAPQATADAVCAEICGRHPTNSEFACLQALSCTANPDDCFNAGTGGGSSGTGGGANGTGGGMTGTGGGMSGTGGGTSNTNPCPIPKENVKVTSPWVTLSPNTVVTIGGYCSQMGTNGNWEGYTVASTRNTLVAHSPANEMQPAGPLKRLYFWIDQRQLTSSELNQISSATGVPVAKLGQSQNLVSPSNEPAVLDGLTLPAGVEMQWFMPSSSAQPGFVLFSTLGAQSDLDGLLNSLGGSNVRVKAMVMLANGGTAATKHRYTLRLRPSFAVTAIETMP